MDVMGYGRELLTEAADCLMQIVRRMHARLGKADAS